jgi:hypothetical protein
LCLALLVVLFAVFGAAGSAAAGVTAPGIEWQKLLGRGDSDNEVAYSVARTTDGGCIVAGRLRYDSNYNYWVVKLRADGDIEWEKSYGGSGDDYAESIAQTADGGYIVAGRSSSNDGNVTGHHGTTAYVDAWVVKLKANGDIDWAKSLGGSDNDNAYSIAQTKDGGYIVAGESYSNDGDGTGNHGNNDAWVVKLRANGDIDWAKSYGGSGKDYFNSIAQTTDGGYVALGQTLSRVGDGDVGDFHYAMDYWVVKLDANGAIEREKSYGGIDSEYAESIAPTADGGCIVAGYSNSNNIDVKGDNHGVMDYWVAKLDVNGVIEWAKSFGGSYGDYAYLIATTSDGGYIVAGTSYSSDGDKTSGNRGYNDAWVVKLSANGAIEWDKSLAGFDNDYAYSIAQTSDGGYIVAGASFSSDGDLSGILGSGSFWVVKLGPDGSGSGDGNKVLNSIVSPAPIADLPNGTAKTAPALGLPTFVTMVTSGGNVSANVSWNVEACSYDPSSGANQTFTVSGTAALPSGVVNTNSVSLAVSVSVTVLQAGGGSNNKVLNSIVSPAPIANLPNGTAKTAPALGLPTFVTMVTSGGNVSANVSWNVEACSYDPSSGANQTFTVSGTAALPSGVVNTNSVSLAVSVSVTVLQAGGGSGNGPDSGGGGGCDAGMTALFPALFLMFCAMSRKKRG